MQDLKNQEEVEKSPKKSLKKEHKKELDYK